MRWQPLATLHPLNQCVETYTVYIYISGNPLPPNISNNPSYIHILFQDVYTQSLASHAESFILLPHWHRFSSKGTVAVRNVVALLNTRSEDLSPLTIAVMPHTCGRNVRQYRQKYRNVISTATMPYMQSYRECDLGLPSCGPFTLFSNQQLDALPHDPSHKHRGYNHGMTNISEECLTWLNIISSTVLVWLSNSRVSPRLSLSVSALRANRRANVGPSFLNLPGGAQLSPDHSVPHTLPREACVQHTVRSDVQSTPTEQPSSSVVHSYPTASAEKRRNAKRRARVES